MDTDILGEVIKVEKELHASLDSEKVKARERLEAAKRGSEKELTIERERLREYFDEQARRVSSDADAAAAAVLEKTAAYTVRLGRITDETLTEIVMKRVVNIME